MNNGGVNMIVKISYSEFDEIFNFKNNDAYIVTRNGKNFRVNCISDDEDYIIDEIEAITFVGDD